jgi:glycosyltransferase involved in cell wall biosynthesis
MIDCSPEKIRVIHNNISNEFRWQPQNFNVDCPRILQIGTAANKNLEKVAQALAGITCRLAIVGPLSGNQANLLKQYAIDYENFTGLSREAMVDQYISSDLVLFVSTYEGFGLPIIEANAVGRPVVTSDVSSMPEVAAGAACLVNPYEASSIRDGVLRVINDEGYRGTLINRGLENARRFRAPAAANQYACIYREVALGLAAP